MKLVVDDKELMVLPCPNELLAPFNFLSMAFAMVIIFSEVWFACAWREFYWGWWSSV
jgi:uncharacterized membrane protein